ncbi:MAG: hypothetical protein DRJ52_02490 [Thermoprotei archaeon]|nr:MAG: hypothetical protein DRJ52_02490 [Thermoprotei archaeon]
MRRRIIIVSVLITILLLCYPISSPPPQVPVKYYAEVVKYPLPGLPEPVLVGGELEVLIKASDKASQWSALIKNKYYGEWSLELKSSSYNKETKIWQLIFKLPGDLKEGLYDLTIEFSEGGSKKTIEEPHSVWVLLSWPDKLRLLVFADTKTPGGADYFYEAIKTINLLNPDLAIFVGDLVERPTSASGWKYFYGSFFLLECPCYLVIGNHEYDYGWVAETYESIVGPQNYSVSFGEFLLIALPTGSDGWIPMKYLKWAERILAETKCKVKMLAFHHPLFSPAYRDQGLNQVIKISSTKDFSKLQQYLYSSWQNHLDEARYLFELIIKYDVRLIFAEHVHTDLNVVIEDAQGRRHYFVTPAAVAYDVREKDIRGFKYLVIYSNGTVDETTLYYSASGLFKYPNSIPIDLGEKVKPYKIGTIEYYYAPANDGKHYAVSFRAKNELKQYFHDIRIVFKLPKDKPLTEYKWYPTTPEYNVIEAEDCYYIVLKNVDLPPESVVKFTVAATTDDKSPLVFISEKLTQEDQWVLLTVEAKDSEWGVDEVKVLYSLDGKEWHKPALMDLVDPEFEKVSYIVWLPLTKEDLGKAEKLYIKVIARDFAGNVNETIKEIALAKPKLEVTVSAPSSLGKGKSSSITIKISNIGDATARDVEVRITNIENLVVESTRIAVGDIEPNKYKEIKISIEGKEIGSASLKVKVYASNYPEVTKTISLEITQPIEIYIAIIAVIVIAVVAAVILLRKRKTS